MSRQWRIINACLLLALLGSISWQIIAGLRHGRPVTPIALARNALLMPGIGEVHHPVSTRVPEAQAFFDQGLALYYGFDKPNAVVSFRKAEELGPSLAMAYWGEACALGRDINYVPDAAERAEGLGAIRIAIKLAPQASPIEQAYIAALAKRYPITQKEKDDELNHDYADAMRGLSAQYPDDLDAAVLSAESIMDLYPWHLWTQDGKPTPGTESIVPTLESVLQRDPKHLGANHFYVHALEASPHPERALAAALLLPQLAPKSPHLVHMPSHILIHTGGYFEAVKANIAASALGDERFSCCGPPARTDYNYHGHNLRFLIYAADMAGMSREAMDASQRLAILAEAEIAASGKDKPFKSDILEYDALVLARFARWDEILQLHRPNDATPRATSRYYFARVLAFAATKDIPSATGEYSSIDGSDLNAGPIVESEKESLEQTVLSDIAGSRIARAKGDFNLAIKFATAAIGRQSAAGYEEPPVLPWPAREELGGTLLEAGNWAGAAQTYRDCLTQFPGSGRSLRGLSDALRHLGKDADADQAGHQFQEAWKNADVGLNVNDL